MNLFLAAEAKNPLSIKKLEEMVGGFRDKKIAYIPTAANGDKDGWEKWKEGGSWNVINTLGAKVTLIVLEKYGDKSVLKLLEGQDIIWFAGGMAGYLMYWLKRCGIDKNLKNILEKNNSWFVGSSAGSMVMGQSLDVGEWFFMDEEIGSVDIKPMGFVDFDIFPHYEENLLEQIKKNHKRNKLYLLKNGEEIIVRNGIMELVGEERILVK
ncbi:MAG TPA: Type 1 glutamine amidotransferase-like domain-containing protein [Candidatus Methanoperedens sp.]|nr:Type 1 glutamine amidotransferase-like domain-containing protein [Candidatus Methanoperedens sp.]